MHLQRRTQPRGEQVVAMSQKEIEQILIRQLAGYLAMAVFIVDADGNLVFYNEPAEHILGTRFDETGEMAATDWATAWAPTDDDGNALVPEALPLWIALHDRRVASGRFWIRGFDNVSRYIEAVAFPLLGQAERHLGAVSLSWEAVQT
jgi:PAS domain-containing protein